MSSDSTMTVALGSRTNIFDSQSGDWDTDRDPKDPTQHQHDTKDDSDVPTVDEMLCRDGPHDYVTGVSRDKFVAGSILRSYGNPDLYCPECLSERDREIELSDPEHHVPLVELLHEWDEENAVMERRIQKNDHRRHRHCPECGLVTFGGSLLDRPKQEFMAVIDAVLQAIADVPPSQCERLRESAEERKEKGKGDEKNLEILLREMRFGTEARVSN